jgi:hypothetical protein
MLGTQADRSGELEARWMELEEELGIDRLDVFLAITARLLRQQNLANRCMRNSTR